MHKDKLKFLGNILVLKELRAGSVVTERQAGALRDLFGPIFDAAKPISTTIHFTKEGEAYTTDWNPMGFSIGGQAIPNIGEP